MPQHNQILHQSRANWAGYTCAMIPRETFVLGIRRREAKLWEKARRFCYFFFSSSSPRTTLRASWRALHERRALPCCTFQRYYFVSVATNRVYQCASSTKSVHANDIVDSITFFLCSFVLSCSADQTHPGAIACVIV